MSTLLKQQQILVGQTIAEIKTIHTQNGINPVSLQQTAVVLARLADNRQLFSFENFPVAQAQGETSVRYQLHTEPDDSYALYLNTQKPGKNSVPHNHKTWVVIVAVEGDELNRIYRRTDDESAPDIGVLSIEREVIVRRGTPATYLGDDIHSIHVEGPDPTLHFHLYGRALETLTDRVAFDLKTGHIKPYNSNFWRPSVIRGRS